MLIAFEGIDGSGKTTLSNALAKRLKKHGVALFHARENGELSSAISAQIRLLTQNPQNAQLTNEAEFLLYAARETQLLEETVRPHLKNNEWVVCDRSLYTSLVLGAYGRRLDRKALSAVLDWASKGLWPELVFFCDVPIETSRVRKKLQKIIDKKTGGGRKGIAGLGLRARLREGYLELARENPSTWIYVDTNRMLPDEALEFAWSKLAPRLGLHGAPTPPEPAPAPRIAPGPMSSLRARYFQAAEQISSRDTRLACYLLNGFDVPEAYQIREKLLPKEATLIAYGLTGLRSVESMNLRERLAEIEPHYTAYSLRGSLAPLKDPLALPEKVRPTKDWRDLFFVEGDAQNITTRALHLWNTLALEAPRGAASSLQGVKTLLIPQLWDVRRSIFEKDPDSALSTVRGLDIEEAWELRHLGVEHAPIAVLRSLARLDSDEAWALREKLFPKAMPIDRLDSLVGLDHERAFALRRKLEKEAPLEALSSVRGLTSDEAFSFRDRYFTIAPKIVVQSTSGMIDERSWSYRERAAEDVLESLEAIRGLSDERSHALRHRLRDRWPFAVISSLGGVLSKTPEGLALINEQSERHPNDLHVAKHALRAMLGAPDEEQDE